MWRGLRYLLAYPIMVCGFLIIGTAVCIAFIGKKLDDFAMLVAGPSKQRVASSNGCASRESLPRPPRF